MLFFGKHLEEQFEKAVIRCLAFKGTNKRFIVDDKIFGGGLYSQYTKSTQWIKEKINIDIEGQGSGPRKEIWEIPETVFKEAIINCLSHGDYLDNGASTMIELYDDRIVISNPGGLAADINKANLGKRSYSRNPLIFGPFARMRLVEQVGSGIIRMNALMQDSGLTFPEFETEVMFTITLYRPQQTTTNTGDKATEDTKNKIISIIKNNASITIPKLAELLSMTPKGVEYHFAEIKREGLLCREGSRKAGKWKDIEK